MTAKAREGDLIQTREGLIFDVKGLVHPVKRVIAFPRFIPDPCGNREREGIVYKKVYNIERRYRILKRQYPHYLVDDPVFGECLSEVPKIDILHHHIPVDHLRELKNDCKLDALETDALRLTELLHDYANVPWNKLGISGSLLVKLHTSLSDIDPIVYGQRSCRKVFEALESLVRSNCRPIKAYTIEGLKILYGFRVKDTRMSFDQFMATECRKILQGKFLGREFYIRCVKDWTEVDENYGDVRYKSVGYARLKATISDNSEAIFTPCRYSLEKVQLLEGKNCGNVTEIASFRGRFCEQAKIGEVVVAQGKVERVETKTGDTFFRLLLGGKRSDFMVLAD